MLVKLEIGSNGYIIESNRTIIHVVVIANHGEFYVLRLPSGGAIRLRRGRIFSSKEDAEKHLEQQIHSQQYSYKSPYHYGA